MPDDPRDALKPEEDAPPSTGAARDPSRPAEDTPSTPDGATTPPRSIFNRFRRGRTAPEGLQTRLTLPEEQPAVEAVQPPTIEPGRSAWRRPASEDAAPAPASVAPVTTDAAPPAHLTPRLHSAAPVKAPDNVPETATPLPATTVTTVTSATPTPPPAVAATAAVTPAPEAPPAPLPEARVHEHDRSAVADISNDDAEPHHGRRFGWAALRPIPVPINPYMLLLAGLATLVTLAYLLVEPSPRWYLIMGAAAVAAGVDGTLRATWRVTYADRDTTPALFMPAIFILAVPPLIEHNMRGMAVIPAGLATGLAFFAIVAAQVGSARPGATYYPWARTVSTAGAYAAGFAFFSLTYVYDLGLGISALATGLVALMLAIEVLREGEIDAAETAGYAAAAGAAVGQWRVALHYLPVDGYLAGLAVLLGFLLVTGLLQAYITRSLDRRTTIDHAVVAVAGAALVIGARLMGLA